MTPVAGSRLWEPRPSRSRSGSRTRSESRSGSCGSLSRRDREAPESLHISDRDSRSSRATQWTRGQFHEPLLTDDSNRLLCVRDRRRELIRNARKESLLDCYIYVESLPRPGRFHRYNALSYSWGPRENHHTILCNNQFVRVSLSLYEALSQYRISQQDKPLWVDALCIDQGNLSERNHQVHLMTKIYALADLVIAWLGPSTPEIELALERLDSGRPPWEKTDIVCETEIFHGAKIVQPRRGQACRARYL
jgi:Heterokaryon incompatibility protein (HET)